LVVARFFDDFLPAHGSASTGYNHTRQFPVGQGLEAIRGPPVTAAGHRSRSSR
jgi:hypothetical protein